MASAPPPEATDRPDPGPRARTDADADADAYTDAIVVGAGFSGLYQLHLLRERGLRVRLFEAGDDVGGTWYWNRYPGARCDIESLSYSYSFSPELDQEWVWSEKYAGQPEILRYLRHVADRFGLRRDITLRTRVTRAAWDGERRVWRVTTDTGETVTAPFVVMASGCNSAPREPDIPGAGDFTGTVHHTSRWPHEEVDLTGRRVAVIGTGSSGVQLVPVLAGRAAEVTVFQRTPAYSMPAWNRPLDGEEIAEQKARYPEFRAAQRRSKGGSVCEMPTRSALEVGEEERTAAYERAWEAGVLSAMLRSYTDILVDAAANETAAAFIRAKIASIVDDPATAEALTPRDYPFATKRPCLDSGYYAAFNDPRVSLVDLRATPIEAITPKGVRTSEREYLVDTIVHATGFDSLTGALTAVEIVGRDGVTLREKWADGPRSLLGLVSAGFPNLFTVTGPLSPSVLTNMVVSIEQHVEWITDCVVHLRERGIAEIDAAPEAEESWGAHVAELAAGTLYPAADSWYLGANVPGKARVFLAYTGGLDRYRAECDAVARDGYRGFVLSGSR
ncbi:NAD(P)/FAD-dependent oxidoreductase [Streptomyces sp. NPDC001985]|uniref:flavin-containing monooxygenase n=1 Tax=Streptomyces sp. NPDC001985 TaxID=3154406 RepID=UPI00332F20F8